MGGLAGSPRTAITRRCEERTPMSLADRFREWADKQGITDMQDADRKPAVKPQDLRLEGQIRQDDIFPSTTDTEQ
jgi:hypothetical protein